MSAQSHIQAKIDKGSQTAKGGFDNEKDVIIRFNNWQEDLLAQNSLITMGYNLKEIEKVLAQKVDHGQKTDVQVLVIVYLKGLDKGQNISVKLVSNKSGFNQIERGWVKKYEDLWNIPERVSIILECFVGYKKPLIQNTKDPRRMFLDEFEILDQELVVKFFEENRMLILSDIIKGRGQFAAEWMLVVQKFEDNISWTLKAMNEVLNIFNQGNVEITNKGSLKIGKIGLQRKGGDGGRDSANQMQFKIDPMEITKY
jgi:R.HinP1I restriction endonuclease